MNKIEPVECEAIGRTSNENEKEVCNDTTPKKIVGIYGLRNKINGKWYVGQSVDVEHRWVKYENGDCRKQRKLYNALKKYGWSNFEATIIEHCQDVEWILDYREMYWIRHLNSMENGYNLTDGGRGGRKSLETRRLMSVWQIGKKHSDETKRKIGLKSIGRKFSKESNFSKGSGLRGKKRPPRSSDWSRKISQAKIGKHLSDDHRKKISDGLKKKRLTLLT